MGNPAAILTHMQIEFDGVKPSEVTDPGNATSRIRLLYQLQRIANYIHSYREWEFTYTDLTIAVAAGNSFLLSLLTDYMEFGREGGLFDADRRIMLRERSRFLIARTRHMLPSPPTAPPDAFTIWGGSVQLPYTLASSTNFSAFYRIRSPTLIDDDGSNPTYAVDNEMLIPDRYIDSVVFPGLIYQNQNMKSDQREVWGTQFREGLIQMAATEMPNKTAVRKMPLANRKW